MGILPFWNTQWVNLTCRVNQSHASFSGLKRSRIQAYKPNVCWCPKNWRKKDWTFWHLQMGVPLSRYLFVEKPGGVFVGPKEMKNASSWSIRAQDFRKISPKQHHSLKGKKKIVLSNPSCYRCFCFNGCIHGPNKFEGEVPDSSEESPGGPFPGPEMPTFPTKK